MLEKTTKGKVKSTFTNISNHGVNADATLFSLAGFQDVAQHHNLRGSVDAADRAMSSNLPALTTDGVTKENHNQRGGAIKYTQSNNIFEESGAKENADDERKLEDADDDIYSNDGKNEDSEDSDNNGQRGNNEFDDAHDDSKKEGGTSYNKREHQIDAGSSGYPRKPAWWPFVCVALFTAVCSKVAAHIEVLHAKIGAVSFIITSVFTVATTWNSDSFRPILWLLVALSFLLASFVFGNSSTTLQVKVATAVLEILVTGPLAMYGWDKQGAPGSVYDFFLGGRTTLHFITFGQWPP